MVRWTVIPVAVGLAVSGPVWAMAADLGGTCCLDLEERVAELEAAGVRKGNRNVKVEVSGWVNEAVMAWDDGFEENAYVVTNDLERSRFRIVGSADITERWSAGYVIEIGLRSNRSGRVDQNNADSSPSNRPDVRLATWYIQSKDLGKLWVGRTTNATYHIVEMDVAKTNYFAKEGFSTWIGGNGAGFFLRKRDGTLLDSPALRWGNISAQGAGSGTEPGEGDRFVVVRYESPAIAGFVASAAFAGDDMRDVALRYTGEIGDYKLAAGIGPALYTDSSGTNKRGCAILGTLAAGETECWTLGLSGSVLHKPTGLFFYGAYGEQHDRKRQAVFGAPVDDIDWFYYLQGGVELKLLDLGKTTLYGEHQHDEVGAGITASTGQPTDFTPLNGVPAFMSGSEIDIWGLGMIQSVDAAAMDFYVAYRHFGADVFTSPTGVRAGSIATQIEPFQLVMTGVFINY